MAEVSCIFALENTEMSNTDSVNNKYLRKPSKAYD